MVMTKVNDKLKDELLTPSTWKVIGGPAQVSPSFWPIVCELKSTVVSLLDLRGVICLFGSCLVCFLDVRPSELVLLPRDRQQLHSAPLAAPA